MCASFPSGFKDGMLDLIALIPDHCLSIYFTLKVTGRREMFVFDISQKMHAFTLQGEQRCLYLHVNYTPR